MAKERLLLVDDEENLRTLVRTTLDQPGYRILESTDGASALALARRERPDVVVLEVLEVLELLLPLVLLFVDVVCPDWVLTPPVPRVAARRRLSAAAASPSDWLYAASGASRHTTATAQKVRVRVRMEGAPP